jgi:hypothetical protein
MVQQAFVVIVRYLYGRNWTGTVAYPADLTLLDIDIQSTIIGLTIDGIERTKGETDLASAA